MCVIVVNVFFSLCQIAERGYIDDQQRLWIRDGSGDGSPIEVAVAYYRSGYTPIDYPTEAHWAARLLVERSRAVKVCCGGHTDTPLAPAMYAPSRMRAHVVTSE